MPSFELEGFEVDDFYAESGVVPFLPLYLTPLVGLLSALALAPLAVAIADWFLDVQSWKVLLIVIFGLPIAHSFLLCFAVHTTANLCHVRNRRFVVGICLLCIPFAYYLFIHGLVWAFGDVGGKSYLALLNPIALWSTLSAWAVGNPHWLNVVAAIAAGVTFLAYFVGVILIPDQRIPYCEECDCTCLKHKTKLALDEFDSGEILNGDLQAFESPINLQDAQQAFVARYYYCRECSNSSYLRLWYYRRPTTTDRGEDTLLLNLLRVPAELKHCFDNPRPTAE